MQRPHSPFQTLSPEKIQDRQQRLEAYVRPYSSAGCVDAIYPNNEADLDMAIAELSHYEDILFNIVESDMFRKVITLERTSGPGYFPPNSNMIGDEL